MRPTTSDALALAGSLALAALAALGAPVPAVAAAASCGTPLGIAGGYTEFAAGDSRRTAGAAGEVLAASLTGAGGAETHHFSYTGCLPPGTTPAAPAPSPSQPGTPVPTPSHSSGAASGGTAGSLARTGGGNDTTALLGAGAAVVALGAGTVVVAGRRRPRTTSR